MREGAGHSLGCTEGGVGPSCLGGMMGEMPRLFIAVPVAETVKTSLGEVSRSVAARYLRWVKPEAMHLTLAFLGDVDEARLPTIERAMREGARGASVMALRAEGVGAFPSERRARVVWAGVTGDVDVLFALQQDLELRLTEAGFEGDRKRFHPHLTLARLREPLPLPAELLTHRVFGEWRATEIQLIESHLGSAGPHYEVRAAAKLEEV